MAFILSSVQLPWQIEVLIAAKEVVSIIIIIIISDFSIELYSEQNK